MPQRFLRPGITTSDAWNSVSFQSQSLFIRLLTIVDDWGRCDGRIPIIHGQCFALRSDIKPQQTAAFRSELQDAGLIEVYSVESKEFVQITKWHERARGDKSKFPDPSMGTPCSQDSAADRSGSQEKDASLATTPSPLHPRHLIATQSGFDDFWMAYPKKRAKGDAEKVWIAKKLHLKTAEILTAIRKAKITEDWTKNAGQFIPYPASWLNSRGWEDEQTLFTPDAPEERKDPDGWREWLASLPEGISYQPFAYVQPVFLKDDFRAFQKANR